MAAPTDHNSAPTMTPGSVGSVPNTRFVTSKQTANSTMIRISTSTTAPVANDASAPLARASAITATVTVGDALASTTPASAAAESRCQPVKSGAIGSQGQIANTVAVRPTQQTSTVPT